MHGSKISSQFSQMAVGAGSAVNNQQPISQTNGQVMQEQAWQKTITQKPCVRYGLDPQKLKNPQLQKYRGYRRLLNIVLNDQTPSSQIFRPNLIKELYFLLQITPFIEDSLKQDFLNKIEQLYNSNDHKKIKLSKNLDGLIQTAMLKKTTTSSNLEQKKSLKRPKSSVGWNKDLHPFLRPYTAKLYKNSASSSQHKSTYRPQSSKFGASTNAQTNFMDVNQQNQYDDNQERCEQDNCEQQLQEKQSCDIEEQWERSLDFKKKYRTLHPQEEPTYEKLMSLICNKKNENKNLRQSAQNDNYLVHTSPMNAASRQWQNKRKIQSAVLTRQMHNAKMLAQKEVNEEIGNKENKQQPGVQIPNYEDDGEELYNQEGYNQQDGEDEEENIDLDDAHGKFKDDRRTRNGRNLQPQGKLYVTLNGAKILRPFTAKQSNIIRKLDQYSGLEQNKRVLESNADEECAQKYKEYTRKKNYIKRQMARKSQSRRYMENFKNVVKIIPNSHLKTPSSQAPLSCSQNSNKQNLLVQLSNEVENQKNIQQKEPIKTCSVLDNQIKLPYPNVPNAPPLSTYNTTKYFQRSTKQKIATSYRTIQPLYSISGSASTSALPSSHPLSHQSKMTFQKRLLSQQKFDPLHHNNLLQYNDEALSQIQKIKQKFGGKISASTQCLMKALYVDAPLPTKLKQDGFIIDKNQTKFQIPDKRYLMVQKEQKKKKKRKLKKMSTSKKNKSLTKLLR